MFVLPSEQSYNFLDTGLLANGVNKPEEKTIAIYTNAIQRLTVDKYGNVGIGVTVTPFSYKLDINGTLNVQDTANFQDINLTGDISINNLTVTGTSNLNDLTVITNSTIQGGTLYLTDTNEYIQSDGVNILIGTNATEQFRINNSGNVGIKTNSPLTALHVNGNIRAQNFGTDDSYLQLASGRGNVWEMRAGTSVDGSNPLRIRNIGSDDYITILEQNGNVGIGVTLPQEKLDVAGNINVSGNVVVHGDTFTVNSTQLSIDDPMIRLADNNSANLTDIGFYGMYVDTGVTKYTGMFKDASESKWHLFDGDLTEPGDNTHITNNAFLTVDTGVTGGSVGINTQNPVVSLDIHANDGILIPVGNNSQRPTGQDGIIRYNVEQSTYEGYGSGAWGSLGGVKDVDQDTYISAEDSAGTDNDELKFFTIGNERMRITNTGQVGIGTNNPDRELQVTKNQNTYSRVLFENTDSGDASRMIHRISSNARYLNFTTFSSGYTTSGAQISSSALIAAENMTGGLGLANLDGDIMFYTGGALETATTERLRINTSGNVGIGTNNPSVKLDINSTDAIKLPIGTNAQRPTGADGLIRYNSEQSTYEGYGNGAWGSLGGVKDVDQDTYISAETSAGTDNDQLQFFTSGTERMRIDSDGQVDIYSNYLGSDHTVNNPTVSVGITMLNIYPEEGTVVIGNTLQTKNPGSGSSGDTGNTRVPLHVRSYGSVRFGNSTTGFDKDFIRAVFGNADGGSQDSYITILADRQNADASNAKSGLLFANENGGSGNDLWYLWGGILGTNNGLEFHTSSDGIFSDLDIQAMTIKRGTGNVGIGTTNPGQKLVVQGGNIMIGTDDQFLGWGDESTLIQGNSSSDYLRFYTASTERLRIDSSGNVGIGTDNPGNKFEVVGNAYIGTQTNEQLLIGDIHAGGWAGIQNRDASQAMIAGTSAGRVVIGAGTAEKTFFGSGNGLVFVNSTDYVGIGTSGPNNLLHIYSTAGNTYTQYSNSGGGSMVVGLDGGENGTIVVGTSDDLNFGTNNTVTTQIDASGNLLPYADNTYDLGSDTNRWKDLYLSGSSINLGGTPISSDFSEGSVNMPPEHLTSNEHTVSGQAEDGANGVYTVTSAAAGGGLGGFGGFTRASAFTDYKSTGSVYTAGIYNGSEDESGTGYLGDWLKIQFPSPYKAASFSIKNVGDVNACLRRPIKYKIFGSNNNSTWTELFDGDGSPIAGGANQTTSYSLTTTGYFLYYLFVTSEVNSSYTYQSIGDLSYNGGTVINSNNITFDYLATLNCASLSVGTDQSRIGNITIDTTNIESQSDGYYLITDTDSTTGERKFQMGIGDNSASAAYMQIEETNNTDNTANIRFFTTPNDGVNALERMMIRYDGVVGIGTNNPSHTLHVHGGDLHVAYGDTNTTESRIFLGGGPGNQFKTAIITDPTGSWGRNKLMFCQNNVGDGTNVTSADAVMTITNGGTVGIGTTSPGYMLQVGTGTDTAGRGARLDAAFVGTWTSNSDYAIFAHRTTAGSGGDYALIQRSNGDTFLNAKSGQSLYLRNNNSNLMTLTSSVVTVAGGIDLNVDSNTLYVDASANSVGIGTATPGDKLHIAQADLGLRFSIANGTYYTEMGQYTTIDPNYFIINARGNSATFGTMRFYCNLGGDTANQSYVHHSRDRWAFAANNVELFRIAESGNVGIGTNSPGALLHLYNAGDVVQRFTNGVAQSWVMGIDDSHADCFKINNGTDISGTPPFTILTGGNIGIGTTNPRTKLHVGSIASDINNFNSEHDEDSISIHHTATSTSNTILNDPKGLLYLLRSGTSGQAYGAGAAFKLCRWENNGTNSRTRLDIDLMDASFSQHHMMTIRSNTNLPQVGIGTTNPNYTTTIYRSDFPTIQLVNNNTGTGASNGSLITLANAGDLQIGTLGSHTVQFLTGSTEKMRIASNGDVGIGTNSTSALLHLYDDNNGYSTQLRLQNPNTGASAVTRMRLDSNAGTAYLDVFGSNNPTSGSEYQDGFRIQSSSSLSGGLVLEAAGSNDITFFTNGTRRARFRNDGLFITDYTIFSGDSVYLGGTSGNQGIVWENSNINFRVNSAHRMTVKSNGNVGIGTTNPGDPLTVTNTVQSIAFFENTQSNEGAYIEVNNQAGTRALFGSDGSGFTGGSTSDIVVGNWSNGNLHFGTNQVIRGELDTSGDFTVTGDVTSFGTISDQRLKENIQTLDNNLDKILQLRPVSFIWKDEDVIPEKKKGIEEDGLIAQEVEEILPKVVGSTNLLSETEYKNINYEKIVPYLIGAIQEQQQMITELRQEINELKDKN